MALRGPTRFAVSFWGGGVVMKKTVRTWILAAALVPAVLGTLSALADRPPRPFCGGEPGGNACPEGFVCVDLPGDHCDPRHGGRDCLGYCKEQRP